jgi:hypothetical protein
MRFVSETYGGDFMNADDVTTAPRDYILDGIEDEMRDGKFIARFHGEEKRLIINKTNAKTLADALGDDVDEWGGATVTLKRGRTTFDKKPTACVEVVKAIRNTNGTGEEAKNISKEPKRR